MAAVRQGKGGGGRCQDCQPKGHCRARGHRQDHRSRKPVEKGSLKGKNREGSRNRKTLRVLLGWRACPHLPPVDQEASYLSWAPSDTGGHP